MSITKEKVKISRLHHGVVQKQYEAEAILLEGSEGVYGLVDNDRTFTVLAGDDGFWWETGCYDKAWLPGMIACLRRLEECK